MPPTLERRLRDLEDRVAITELVSRLYVLLDGERFDELGSVYTEDVALSFPSAQMRGLEAVEEVARRRAATFRRMQHVSTDVVVELDGDRAVVRTNHLSFHLKDEADRQAHFDAGIVHRFDAVRTPDGWRLSRGEASVIWTNGG